MDRALILAGGLFIALSFAVRLSERFNKFYEDEEFIEDFDFFTVSILLFRGACGSCL
jgi:phage anti-repressor protein